MASDQSFVDYILDQVSSGINVVAKKMFGEYALYVDNKIPALICDNQLFIKQTEGGRAFIGQPVEAPPYKGAKNYFLIEDKLDDREWLCSLIETTINELPEPKPKKKKKKE